MALNFGFKPRTCPSLTCECGICGLMIMIPKSPDGRFLVWPCHCQTDRDMVIAKQAAATLGALMGAIGKKKCP